MAIKISELDRFKGWTLMVIFKNSKERFVGPVSRVENRHSAMGNCLVIIFTEWMLGGENENDLKFAMNDGQRVSCWCGMFSEGVKINDPVENGLVTVDPGLDAMLLFFPPGHSFSEKYLAHRNLLE